MYRALFIRVDGLDEAEVGNSVGLLATTKETALDEAIGLTPPEGANFVRIVDLNGNRVSNLGCAL